jgi:hypothetical protein
MIARGRTVASAIGVAGHDMREAPGLSFGGLG